MKRFGKILSMILVVFVLLSLMGCCRKDNDDLNAQNAIKKFINTYYTIDKTDMERYKEIVFPGKSESMKKQISSYQKSTEEFKSLLTDKAYQNLTIDRKSYGRVKEAYKGKYYMTVKSIKLDKQSKDEKLQTIEYYYNLELTQKPILGNKTKTVKDRGEIQAVKVKNTWKVFIDFGTI